MRSDIQIPHCLQDVCAPQEETSQEEIKLKTMLVRNCAESEKPPNYHFCCNLLLKACGLAGPPVPWESCVRWLRKGVGKALRDIWEHLYNIFLSLAAETRGFYKQGCFWEPQTFCRADVCPFSWL